jgi:hypothetical protein
MVEETKLAADIWCLQIFGLIYGLVYSSAAIFHAYHNSGSWNWKNSRHSNMDNCEIAVQQISSAVKGHGSSSDLRRKMAGTPPAAAMAGGKRSEYRMVAEMEEAGG